MYVQRVTAVPGQFCNEPWQSGSSVLQTRQEFYQCVHLGSLVHRSRVSGEFDRAYYELTKWCRRQQEMRSCAVSETTTHLVIFRLGWHSGDDDHCHGRRVVCQSDGESFELMCQSTRSSGRGNGCAVRLTTSVHEIVRRIQAEFGEINARRLEADRP